MEKIDKDIEFRYLMAFAFQSDFSYELHRKQLQALWTAYCFHQNIDTDTAEYDNSLLELWNKISKTCPADVGGIDWSCYDKFDWFMCEQLS